MSVMSSHFDRLNKIGGRTLSLYMYSLVTLAAISAIAAMLLVYSAYILGGGDQSGLNSMPLQVAAALLASLAASASVATVILNAAKRLLSAYIAVVLHEMSAKTPETPAELPPTTRVQETITAQQPPKLLTTAQPKPPVPSASRAVAEKAKCPYCSRPLPFGDVHVICPYCGRRLK